MWFMLCSIPKSTFSIVIFDFSYSSSRMLIFNFRISSFNLFMTSDNLNSKQTLSGSSSDDKFKEFDKTNLYIF